MHRKNYLTIVWVFLLALTVTCSTSEKEKTAVASGGTYEDLVSLFQEFREFQEPAEINGVPDYTEAAMKEKRLGLNKFRTRLEAIDPNGWPTQEKADYVLVWAEMNGMEFYHDVLKPWSRDPVFYLPSQGGAGPVIDINLRVRSMPIPDDRIEEFKIRL